MEGGSVPGETTDFLQQCQALPEDREAIIQACYEPVCSGRQFSEILAKVKELSAVATTSSIAHEICAAGAPCAGASESENIHAVDLSHSLGSRQPDVPSRMEWYRLWPAIGLFIVSL